MTKHFVLTALAAAVLSGCSMIPTYERPAAPVPAQYTQAADTASTPAPRDWQQYFTDARLQQLIGIAL
ncbi:MAG: multidrug transporter, partial [Comamonadaceae bacterium]|nr:multidrug transporter [Comamonadaceae bacterium]